MNLRKVIALDNVSRFNKHHSNDFESFRIAAEYNATKIGMYLFKKSLRTMTVEEMIRSFNQSELLFYLKLVILTNPYDLISYSSTMPGVFEYALTKGLTDNRNYIIREGKELMYRFATIGMAPTTDSPGPIDPEYYYYLTLMMIRPTLFYHSMMTGDMISMVTLYDNINTYSSSFSGSQQLFLVDCLSHKLRPILLHRYAKGVKKEWIDHMFCGLLQDGQMEILEFLHRHNIKPSTKYLKMISLILFDTTQLTEFEEGVK